MIVSKKIWMKKETARNDASCFLMGAIMDACAAPLYIIDRFFLLTKRCVIAGDRC